MIRFWEVLPDDHTEQNLMPLFGRAVGGTRRRFSNKFNCVDEVNTGMYLTEIVYDRKLSHLNILGWEETGRTTKTMKILYSQILIA